MVLVPVSSLPERAAVAADTPSQKDVNVDPLVTTPATWICPWVDADRLAFDSDPADENTKACKLDVVPDQRSSRPGTAVFDALVENSDPDDGLVANARKTMATVHAVPAVAGGVQAAGALMMSLVPSSARDRIELAEGLRTTDFLPAVPRFTDHATE